jgi:CRP-like cAMP-binding protein
VSKLDNSLLAPLPPFRTLDSGQIRDILALAAPRRYDVGETIFAEGAEAEAFFLLLDGYVRAVRITEDGDQVVALHISSGQLFGIARAIGRTTYPASALAAAECLVLSWPTTHWDAFIRDYPRFASETYSTVGRRMGELNDRIVEMSTLHVEQRVANAILRLVRQAGRKTEQGIEIDFAVTRQDIAEMAGTTLHTVSRLLSGWQKSGVVESRRKFIVVTAPHKLVVFAETGHFPG